MTEELVTEIIADLRSDKHYLKSVVEQKDREIAELKIAKDRAHAECARVRACAEATSSRVAAALRSPCAIEPARIGGNGTYLESVGGAPGIVSNFNTDQFDRSQQCGQKIDEDQVTM